MLPIRALFGNFSIIKSSSLSSLLNNCKLFLVTFNKRFPNFQLYMSNISAINTCENLLAKLRLSCESSIISLFLTSPGKIYFQAFSSWFWPSISNKIIISTGVWITNGWILSRKFLVRWTYICLNLIFLAVLLPTTSPSVPLGAHWKVVWPP